MCIDASIPSIYPSIRVCQPRLSASCHCAIGLIPYITGLILMAVKEYTWYNVVNYICAIFPPYTLLCGLFTMSNKNIIRNDASLSTVRLFGAAEERRSDPKWEAHSSSRTHSHTHAHAYTHARSRTHACACVSVPCMPCVLCSCACVHCSSQPLGQKVRSLTCASSTGLCPGFLSPTLTYETCDMAHGARHGTGLRPRVHLALRLWPLHCARRILLLHGGELLHLPDHRLPLRLGSARPRLEAHSRPWQHGPAAVTRLLGTPCRPGGPRCCSSTLKRPRAHSRTNPQSWGHRGRGRRTRT